MNAFSFYSLQSPMFRVQITLCTVKKFNTTKFKKKIYRSKELERGSITGNSWDQKNKNKEVIKQIHEKDVKRFRLL